MRTTNQTLTRLLVFLCLAVPSFWGGSFVFADTTVADVPINDGTSNSTTNVTLKGDGLTAATALEIGSVNEWNAFARYVNINVDHRNVFAKITADITFTNNHLQPSGFTGTLDGQGHTITLHQSDSKESGGRFPHAQSYSWGGLFFVAGNGMTIKNLRLAGEIRNNKRDCGTFIQNSNTASCTLENCQSSVEIIKTGAESTSGGLIGGKDGSTTTTITIKNCLVDGKFKAVYSGESESPYNGGFMGRTNANTTIKLKNSYAHPQEIDSKFTNFYPFCNPLGTDGSAYTPAPTITPSCSYYSFPAGANLVTTGTQGTNQAASADLLTKLNSGDNASLADNQKPWIVHNDTVYLKTFAKYVHIDGWTYGSPNTPTIVGNNGNGTVTYQVKKGSGDYVDYTAGAELDAGDYTLKASVAANGGWNAWESTMDFTVSKASLIVSDPTATAVYGTQVKDIPISGMVLFGETTVAGTWAFPSDNTTVPVVGSTTSYLATFTPTTGADNYYAVTKLITPTITPRSLTITGITASNKTYDGNTTATLAYTNATFAGKVGSDILSVSATGQFASKDVGTGKTVTISTLVLAGESAGNYTIASSSQSTTTANITPRPLTITGITASNKTYDGSTTAIVNGTGAIISGLISGDDLTCTYTGEFDNANVGTGKAVTVNAYISGGASAGNYQVASCNSPTAAIAPKALTVTANPKTITYGDAPANDGVTYSGFITGEDENTSGVLGGTLAYNYSYAQYDNVGDNYTITPSGLTSNNYAITYNTGKLTVLQKALTITAKDQAISYGTTIAKGTGQVTTEGLVTGDALTDVTLTPSTSDYTTNGTITPSDATTTKGIGNYSVTYTDGALTIGKVALTITAKDKTITYGDAPANDGVTYSGFIGDDDESVLGGTLAYTYNYAQYDDVGSYTITPNGLTSTNYAITFTPGTLTVGKKEVGVKWGTTVLPYKEGVAQAPTATATGLIEGDECIVTVGGQQTAVGQGYTATATGLTGAQSGNYKLPTTGISVNFEIARLLSVLFAAGQQWATWYDDEATHNYVMPEGIECYVVKDVIGTKVIVEKLSLGYVPAQTGLLLKRATTTAAQEIVSDIFTGDLSNAVPSSLLTVGSPMPDVAYMLQDDVFFVTTESTLPEHSCYLPDLGTTTTVDDPSAILGPSLIPARYVEANKPYADTFYDGTWKPYGDAMTYLPVDYNLDEGTVSLVKVKGAPNGQPVILDAAEDSQTAHYFLVSVLDDETAQSILDDYKSKAAVMNGRFVITDGTKTITEIISGAGVTADEALLLVLTNGKFSTVDVSAADLDKKAKAGLLLFVLTKWEYMHVKPGNGNSQGYVGSRTISIIDNNATGIEEMHDVRSMMDDAWYNLQGRKIDLPTRKGLYIRNGKKIVIR